MPASIEKARAAFIRYRSSPKGKDTIKKYQTSINGREFARKRSARYKSLNPEKIRLINAKYSRSEKGRATARKAQASYSQTPYGRVAIRIRAYNRHLLKRVCKKDVLLITEWEKRWRTKVMVCCFWCRAMIRPRKAHTDHIIPLAKGGSHAVGNLCISCAPCNLSKNAKELHRWNGELKEPVLL
jgi:5-methylcytosine-specific restriction endonuclease McrA